MIRDDINGRRRRRLALGLALLGASAGCGFVFGGGPSMEVEADATVREAIAETGRAFSDAYVRGDSEAIAALYTEDALLLPPGDEIRGRDAIEEYFRPRPDLETLNHTMTSEELTISGPTAIEIGSWTSTLKRGVGQPRTYGEKYLIIWKRQSDGSWRMQYDMWHRPRPARSE